MDSERREEAIDIIELVAIAMETAAWSEERCGLSADVCRLGSRAIDAVLSDLRDGS